MSASSRNERSSTERTSTLRTPNPGQGHVRKEAETKKKELKVDAKRNTPWRNFVQTGKRGENEQTARARRNPPVPIFRLPPPASLAESVACRATGGEKDRESRNEWKGVFLVREKTRCGLRKKKYIYKYI